MDAVGFFHAGDEGIDGLGHAVVVEGADFEVEILKGIGGHLGELGHAGGRPAEDAPSGVVDALLEVDGFGIETGPGLHLGVGDAGHFTDIGAAAEADVGVHFGHAEAVVVGPGGEVVLSRGLIEGAEDAVGAEGYMGVATHGPGGPDEGDGHFLGDVEGFDEDMFAGLEAGGVVDEEFGEGVYSGIVHF